MVSTTSQLSPSGMAPGTWPVLARIHQRLRVVPDLVSWWLRR